MKLHPTYSRICFEGTFKPSLSNFHMMRGKKNSPNPGKVTELPPKLQARSTNAVTCQAKDPTLDPKHFTSPFGSLNNALWFHLKMQMLLENAGNASISDTSQDMKLDHKSALAACFGVQFLRFFLRMCHFSASKKDSSPFLLQRCRPRGSLLRAGPQERRARCRDCE